MTLLQNSRVYWYPGCANDLVPILLMSPKSHCFGKKLGNRLSNSHENSMHLWLTDLQGGDNPTAFFAANQPYENLWRQFNAEITKVQIDSHPNSSMIENLTGKHYYITVEIKRNDRLESHSFTFTCGDALELYQAFVQQSINLTWLALIKFNAMAGSIGRLPNDIDENIRKNGVDHPSVPELIISDGYFNYPNLPFVRLGSRSLDWGDPNRYIVRGGGVRGWGFGNTSTNWALPQAYERYVSFL